MIDYINYNPKDQQFGIKPYILRAYIGWIEDMGEIPMIRVVRRYTPETHFPDGLDPDVVVLNISHTAAPKVTIDNHYVHVHTRFAGIPYDLMISVGSIMAVFAENGERGTVLPLMIANGVDMTDAAMPVLPPAIVAVPPIDPNDSPNSPRPPRGKPSLRIVK